MHRIFFTFVAGIEWALRGFGLDVHTQLDDSGQGLFAFERREHGAGGRELWGLGLYICVGTIQRRKATAEAPQAV